MELNLIRYSTQRQMNNSEICRMSNKCLISDNSVEGIILQFQILNNK